MIVACLTIGGTIIVAIIAFVFILFKRGGEFNMAWRTIQASAEGSPTAPRSNEEASSTWRGEGRESRGCFITKKAIRGRLLEGNSAACRAGEDVTLRLYNTIRRISSRLIWSPRRL